LVATVVASAIGGVAATGVIPWADDNYTVPVAAGVLLTMLFCTKVK
jgi:uncharacterized membrane protein YccC